jgi:hypothetical protein
MRSVTFPFRQLESFQSTGSACSGDHADDIRGAKARVKVVSRAHEVKLGDFEVDILGICEKNSFSFFFHVVFSLQSHAEK